MQSPSPRAAAVIDPGHGGAEPNGKSSPSGATGSQGLTERDVTLPIAQQVAGALGAQLTRGPGANPSLAQRIEVARDADAQAFVSVHADGSASPESRFQVWLHEGASVDSQHLAEALTAALQILGATAAPRRGQLAVLSPSYHADQTAACLVDVGPLYTVPGRASLASASEQAAIAASIAKGIESFSSARAPRTLALASALSLIDITHAGPYRLAYDRHTTLGVLGKDRDTRSFRGTQSLQDALNTWASYLPSVIRAPSYVMTGGLYVNKPGEHGRGTAVDIDGFWWSATDKLLANDAPSDWYTYLRIEATLRKSFGTVLNYDYNAAHHDHWHCDLGHPTHWRAANSQVLFVKRALNEVWGANLTVDRRWDAAARDAARSAGYDLSVAANWDRFLDSLISASSR